MEFTTNSPEETEAVLSDPSNLLLRFTYTKTSGAGRLRFYCTAITLSISKPACCVNSFREKDSFPANQSR